MATRSFIGYVTNDSTVKYCYVHYDGYLDGVGQTLLDKYNTLAKVKKLIKYGEYQTIIDKLKFFDDKLPVRVCNSIKDYIEIENNTFIDYLYLFKDNEWFVLINDKLERLSFAIEREKHS